MHADRQRARGLRAVQPQAIELRDTTVKKCCRCDGSAAASWERRSVSTVSGTETTGLGLAWIQNG
jgi:hypothetical protein